MAKPLTLRPIYTGEDVESDSPPTSHSSFRGLETIMEGAGTDQRPKQLPLNHLPPKRTSSQERFSRLSTTTPIAASSPHTISTPNDMPLFLQHLHNMSDEDVNRIPEDVYKRYIREKADKIVQEVVPEPSHEVNCLMRQQTAPSPVEEVSYAGYPKQSTLFPLAQDQLEVGQDGRYFERRNYNRVEDLGEGGFGMVYACQDTCNEKLFAIKCNSQSDEKKVSSMQRECEVLHSLGPHQNITRFLGSLMEDYETEIKGKSLKMLMECAINGSLDEMLIDPETEECGLPMDQSLYYLQQILKGVNYLHQKYTLHLDLKCKNILVFDEGRTVKLADFGSAMKKEEIPLTGSLVAFTPHYSSPEVINQSEVPSYSADIWSVMCVLVEMWTGKMPWCYKGEQPQHCVMFQVGHYDVTKDFKELVPYEDEKMQGDRKISQEVLDLLKEVLIKDSKARPSAIELLNRQIIIKAVEYEAQFDWPDDMENEEETLEDENQPLQQNDTVAFHSCPPIPIKRTSTSSDSGIGRSLPGRLSSSGSGSSYIASQSTGPNAPYMVPTRYQIFRHESAPFFNSCPPADQARFEEISAHFKTTSATTIPSNYRPFGLLHSNSAPPDIYGSHRLTSRGLEDVERDGPTPKLKGNLKRTPSAQYVSNGPEVDSPDGRRGGMPTIGSPGSGSVTPHFLTSPTSNGMVSKGTQTSLSPTIEVMPPFPGPQTINCYNRSQTSILHC